MVKFVFELKLIGLMGPLVFKLGPLMIGIVFKMNLVCIYLVSNLYWLFQFVCISLVLGCIQFVCHLYLVGVRRDGDDDHLTVKVVWLVLAPVQALV